MYICICKAITDEDIKNAVNDGAQDLAAVQSQLGVSTGCGTCLEHAEEVIDQALTESLVYAA